MCLDLNKNILLIVIVFLFSCSGENESQPITLSPEDYPVEVIEYTDTYFTNDSIVSVEYDNYDTIVLLSNDVKLTFNDFFQIISIISENGQPLPDDVIPEEILIYVKANYPSEYITAWQLKEKEKVQIVTLSNYQMLSFDLLGNIIS